MHQHLGKRAAGRGFVCADGAVTVRGDRAGLHGPEHRLLRPRADGAAVAPCGEIARGEGMLGNEKFVARAPQNVVDAERAKLEDNRTLAATLEGRIAELREMA